MALDAQTQLSHVPVVAVQTRLMADRYRHWPHDYWQRETFCPGWKAVDAIAHLATGADFYAQVITSGRERAPQLPWGATDLAGFRAARTAAAQQLIGAGPEALLAGFESSAATLQTVLESLQEADLSKSAYHPRGLVPIGAWVGMRLNELGMHDWDIREPHEALARLSPPVLPALLKSLSEIQEQFLAQRAEGIDGIYAMRTEDLSWGFTVEGKNVTYHPEEPTAFNVCVSTDAENMILLTMGRADMQAKLESEELSVEGEVEEGQRFCATLFRAF